jgi:hypothetical protein
MNFLDTYDVTGTSTPSESQQEQTLNEEVSDVIGHIGRFWGGFRRQARTLRAQPFSILSISIILEPDCISDCSE